MLRSMPNWWKMWENCRSYMQFWFYYGRRFLSTRWIYLMLKIRLKSEERGGVNSSMYLTPRLWRCWEQRGILQNSSVWILFKACLKPFLSHFVYVSKAFSQNVFVRWNEERLGRRGWGSTATLCLMKNCCFDAVWVRELLHPIEKSPKVLVSGTRRETNQLE